MLSKRIIACLDVRDGRVVKGVNFVDLKDAGDPVEQADVIMVIGANPVAPAGQGETPVGLKDFPRNMIMRRLKVQGVLVGSRKMLEDAVAVTAEVEKKPIM